MSIKVSELKKQIIERNFDDRDNQLVYCRMLLEHAQKEHNEEDIAFAYLWIADYYYYVKRDMNALQANLELARKHMTSQPSRNLIHYYILKAMNNDSTYDVLSRLDCYLEIIKNARALNDKLSITTANGNIAELFHLCHDYKTAQTYSVTVYEQYKVLENARAYNKAILLTNIVELSYYANDASKALYYIEELKNLHGDFKLYPIYLNICYIRYYTMTLQMEDTQRLERELLQQLKLVEANRDIKYECLIIMIESMLAMKAADEVFELIQYMETLFSESDINRWLQILKMRIEYATLLHDTEMLTNEYKRYIKAYELVEKANQDTKIKGLRAHIEIQNIMKHEETLLVDNRSLENESMLDMMTKLYNRRYFNNCLVKLQQRTSLQSSGFALFDVDYFKEYNDVYGHIKGDQVLIQVADILKNTNHKNIIPCRFGGDEFICIFIDMDEEAIEAYIRNVMKQLKATAIPHIASKCTSIVTLSIGYGMRSIHEGFHHDELLEEIDKALYVSKQKGRDTFTKSRTDGDQHA